MLVEGEAGVGKSRLVREFTDLARTRGATVMSGACFPFTETVPYAPLVVPLAQLEVDPARMAERAGNETDRGRYLQTVADALTAVARTGPLVLTVEDLHWADAGTGDLLLFLAHDVGRRGLLMLTTRRTDESARATGLVEALGELVRGGRAERIVLRPLAGPEISDLVAGILATVPPAELVDRIVRRAEGNPFFTEELVAAGGGEGLPENLRELILARASRLGPGATAVLRIVAVAGRRIDHRLLAALAGDRDDLDASIREGVAHHLLVVEGDGYAFRHALMQEAVYADLLPGERRALHLLTAEALTEQPELSVSGTSSAAAELAHHWYAGRRLPEALEHSVVAAARASDRWAPAEALHHYRRGSRDLAWSG